MLYAFELPDYISMVRVLNNPNRFLVCKEDLIICMHLFIIVENFFVH